MQNKKSFSPLYDAIISAPFGAVGVTIHGRQACLDIISKKMAPVLPQGKLAIQVSQEVEAYLLNAYHYFNLPLIYRGTPFQRKVWQIISAIPTGQVMTYTDIAKELGSGPRAVANACGANQMPLIIPCHRVVAKKGIGGFMQGDPKGQKVKAWLLKHEGVHV